MIQQKRTEKVIFSLLKSVADANPLIRAVLLNGSRVNPELPPDPYQDYDVAYVVTDLQPFLKRPNWIAVFGERLLLQIPDLMDLGDGMRSKPLEKISYLMLFTDTNRIDLSLIPVSQRTQFRDSLTSVLLDKDSLYHALPTPSTRDYWIAKPSQKAFTDCCNEFWWVCTYVIKGLLRRELVYAKAMLEGPVRTMLMRLLSWEIGTRTNFAVDLGANYKYLKQYVSNELWEQFAQTYPSLEEEPIWHSLKVMISLFEGIEREVAQRLNYAFDASEIRHLKTYLAAMTTERKESI